MQKISDDYDSPWKLILETYFHEFMEFFFPRIAEDTDWDRGYEFLDKEFQQIVRDAELGKRLADKLVRVWRKNGDEAWVLIHIEIQGYEEPGFPKRMYVYNYRVFDRYDRSVVSLALLTDDREKWRPDCYTSRLWGCETGIKFPVVKILDYKDKWDEMEASANPFAAAVMAHLKTRETSDDPQNRKKWKLYLIRRLYEKGYSRQDVINLFHFTDWLMRLPSEMEKCLGDEIRQYEKEKNMPYVSTIERIAVQDGLQQGLREGLQQGIRQGLQQGIRQGLIEAMELGLTIKFGAKGLKLMPVIQKIEDNDQLKMMKEAVKIAKELKEVEELLPVRD